MAELELDLELQVHGSCLCEGVQFELDICEECSDLYMCHCSRCRKRSGGAGTTNMLVPNDALRWVVGENLIEFCTINGQHAFCSQCGSLLPMEVSSLGKYWIPVGLLEQDPSRPLSTHLYVDSKADWDIICDTATQHPEGFDS